VGDNFCPNGHDFVKEQQNFEREQRRQETLWLPLTLQKASEVRGSPEIRSYTVSGQFEQVFESIIQSINGYSWGINRFKVRKSDANVGYIMACVTGKIGDIEIRAYIQPGDLTERIVVLTCARDFPTLPIPPDWKKQVIDKLVAQLPFSLHTR
jgi:hypothetical protein